VTQLHTHAIMNLPSYLPLFSPSCSHSHLHSHIHIRIKPSHSHPHPYSSSPPFINDKPLWPDLHTGYTLCLLDVWLNSKVAAVVSTELNQASLKCALQSHLAIAASMAYSCLAACQWLDAALQWTSMSHAWLCCTAYCTNKACWPHDCSDSL